MRYWANVTTPKTLEGHERRIDYLEKRPRNGPYYPMHQSIGLNAILNFGYTVGSPSMVTDTTVWTNHYLSVPADGQIHFMFMLGPRFALHEVVYTHIRDGSQGTLNIDLARLSEDGDSSEGFEVPDELIQDFYLHPPDWISAGSFPFTGASDKNKVEGTAFRIMGAEGDDFTTLGTDPDTGQGSIDGGPGVYVMRFTMSGGPGNFSQIDVHRIVDSGWV